VRQHKEAEQGGGAARSLIQHPQPEFRIVFFVDGYIFRLYMHDIDTAVYPHAGFVSSIPSRDIDWPAGNSRVEKEVTSRPVKSKI
jgi:hypothetical protein